MSSLDLFAHIRNGVLVRSSEVSVRVKSDTRTVRLIGSVEFIADYHSLTLARPSEADVVRVLERWCQSTNLVEDVHHLTDLVGPFIVVVEDGPTVRYIYKSGDIDLPVYFGAASSRLIVSSSWLDVLKENDCVEVSRPDLEYFLLNGSCEYPRTFFRGLSLLQPYSLYRLSEGNLSLLTHSYPGFHTVDPVKPPQYTIAHYLKALACYKDHFNSFSVAYSGGVDSNLLAIVHEGKVTQFLTLRYEGPYDNLNRAREVMASREMARKHGTRFTEVVVDLADVSKLDPYFRHYVRANPFSSYLAVHFYSLTEQALEPVILHGQNADNIWDWGFHQIYFSKRKPHSTSGYYIFPRIARDVAILRDRSASVKTKVRRIATRYVTRFAMISSNKKIRLRRLIELVRPFGPEYDCLTRFPYKIFVLQRYINYCTTGESLSWLSSAAYHSKRSLSAYVSPIALHVNSHIRRRNFFDIKQPFRRFSSEFDPSVMDIEAVRGNPASSQPEDRSPLFDHLSPGDNKFLDPDLTKLINGSTKRIARHHAYCVLEELRAL